MHQITGLPHIGEDPVESLKAKDGDVQQLYAKYNTHRGARIDFIDNQTIRFTTQLLACKLLRKCHKDKCPLGVILATKRCATGVRMAWANYMVNEFISELCRRARF